MEFKRKESFRHTLLHPIDFECVVRHPEMDIAVQANGKILDISPQGLNISLLQPLPEEVDACRLSLDFKIFDRIIRSEGEIVWKKSMAGEEYRYGVKLIQNETVQEMIIEDLKARRRREVKLKNS